MTTADPHGAWDPDACPHCDEAVTPASSTSNGWERGSCRSCGLQTVRPPGERWRAIRG